METPKNEQPTKNEAYEYFKEKTKLIEGYYNSENLHCMAFSIERTGVINVIVAEDSVRRYIGKNGILVKEATKASKAKGIQIISYEKATENERKEWREKYEKINKEKDEILKKQREEEILQENKRLSEKLKTASSFSLTTDQSLRTLPNQTIYAKSYPISVNFPNERSQNLADFCTILSVDDLEYVLSEVLPGVDFDIPDTTQETLDTIMKSDAMFEAQKPVIEKDFQERESLVRSFFDEKTWLVNEAGYSAFWLCSGDSSTKFFSIRDATTYSDQHAYYFRERYLISKEDQSRLLGLKTLYENLGGDKEIMRKLLPHITISFTKIRYSIYRDNRTNGSYYATISLNGIDTVIPINSEGTNLTDRTATRAEVLSKIFGKKYSPELDPNHNEIAAENVREEIKEEARIAKEKELEKELKNKRQEKLENCIELAEKTVSSEMSTCPLCGSTISDRDVCENRDSHEYENIDFNPGNRYRDRNPVDLKVIKTDGNKTISVIRIGTNGIVERLKWDYLRYGGWDGYTPFENLSVETFEPVKLNMRFKEKEIPKEEIRRVVEKDGAEKTQKGIDLELFKTIFNNPKDTNRGGGGRDRGRGRK